MTLKFDDYTIDPTEKEFSLRTKTEEIHYRDLTNFIQIHVLGFCGCGQDVLYYVLWGLRLISWPDGMTYETLSALREDHFGSSQAEYFFWFWCHKEELTEHGGCVPGWLDSDGEKLLSLLELWEQENNGK